MKRITSSSYFLRSFFGRRIFYSWEQTRALVHEENLVRVIHVVQNSDEGEEDDDETAAFAAQAAIGVVSPLKERHFLKTTRTFFLCGGLSKFITR